MLKRCTSQLIVALLAPTMTSTTSLAEEAKTCRDAFSKPPFSELRLIDYKDMSELSSILRPLIGLECSLDELHDYFVSKGASVEEKTKDNIYMEVTTTSKFLRSGSLRLPTSIIARVSNGKVAFIDATVTFF